MNSYKKALLVKFANYIQFQVKLIPVLTPSPKQSNIKQMKV